MTALTNKAHHFQYIPAENEQVDISSDVVVHGGLGFLV